ncbi:histidine kinase [Hymenobacter sp. 15J16-1T3B]|uniref:sensor histidine kinase n=1 Tax=Hymenobacter sp. 15J16-1T3B TaxID=2886941 RepID=UPI001D120EE8|nr:histidine kinase [Hymenobacter sp. 15J16-1T3B]MCC3158424.1 histidine kinase [Hymenobacter sp. 15J16-1T3B]
MLRRLTIAGLTAVAWFYTVVFIKLGTLWFFDLRGMVELPFIFCFLLACFWVHEQIARVAATKTLGGLPGWSRKLLEGAAVAATGIVLSVLFVFLPQYLLIPTAEFPPQAVRLVLVVTAVASLFFYYFVEGERVRKKLQQAYWQADQLQKESYQAQLAALKSQVNPHFLFNSLNVLGSLIYKNQDQAAAFLQRLSGVYRAVLEHSDQATVPLRAELGVAEAYIYLMKTRFGDTLDIAVRVPVQYHACRVPPAVLQLLLENAFKHNRATKSQPLRVRLFVADDWLVVENNRQLRLEPEPGTGHGLPNVVRRYQHLTDRPVTVLATDDTFTVRLPLLPAAPDA